MEDICEGLLFRRQSIVAISLGHTENGEPLFANFTFEDWALLSREALGEKSLGFPGHVVVFEASGSSCTSSPATSIESQLRCFFAPGAQLPEGRQRRGAAWDP